MGYSFRNYRMINSIERLQTGLSINNRLLQMLKNKDKASDMERQLNFLRGLRARRHQLEGTLRSSN